MPEMAQPDFDELGGWRSLARRFGGSLQAVETHITGLVDQVRGLPTNDQTIINKADADALKAYRALGTVEEIQAKFVKDTDVVVPKTDAEELALYRGLGAKPDELKSKIEQGAKDAAALALAETRTSAVGFAKAAGLAESTVDTLVHLPQLAGAKFEVRTVKVDDGKGGQKDQQKAYITLAGEGQTAMEFTAAEEKLPVLKGLARATTEQGDTSTGGTGASWGGTGGTGSGTGGNSGGGGNGKGYIDTVLEQMGKSSSAPNALSPAAAATA